MDKQTKTPRQIMIIAANVLELKIKDLKSKCRKRELADCRKVVWYWAREKSIKRDWYYLGRLFNCTHAAALSSVKRANELIETNPWFKKKIRIVGDKLETIKTIKMKVIVKKDKKNEGYYRYHFGEIWSISIPYLYSDDLNEKKLIEYAKILDNVDLDFSDYEFREIEIKLK